MKYAPGCLRVRPVRDDWHAVFQGSPPEVELRLRVRIGADGVRCARVPLEELFIEMVGAAAENTHDLATG